MTVSVIKRPWIYKPSINEAYYLSQRGKSRMASYHLFNQGGGDLSDDSIHRVNGARESNTVVTWINNHTGRAAKFDNSTTLSDPQYGFDLGNPPSLRIPEEITILAGVTLRDDPGGYNWGRLISKTNGGTGDNYGVVFEARGGANRRQISFRINNNSMAGSILPAETYTHIACTYKSGQRRIYVNGTIDASDALTGAITTTGNVKIGNHGSAGDRGLRGDIHYLYVIPRALTESQVRSYIYDNYQDLAPIERINFIPEPAVGGTVKSNPFSGPFGGPFAGPFA